MTEHSAALYVERPSSEQFEDESSSLRLVVGGDDSTVVMTEDELQYLHAVELRSRHTAESKLLVDFFCREQDELRAAQNLRQERCPVCDYRSLNHQERLALQRGDQLLRHAHTLVIRDEKKYFYEFGRLPNQKNYWDLLDYSPECFQRALLGHAQEIQEAELRAIELQAGTTGPIESGSVSESLEEFRLRAKQDLGLLESSLEVQSEARLTKAD